MYILALVLSLLLSLVPATGLLFPSLQRIKSEQSQLDQEWDRRRVAEAKAGLLLEHHANKEREQLRHRLVEENKQIAAEQRAR